MKQRISKSKTKTKHNAHCDEQSDKWPGDDTVFHIHSVIVVCVCAVHAITNDIKARITLVK